MDGFVLHRSDLVPTIPRPGCIAGVTARVNTFSDGQVQVLIAGAHAEMTPDAAERFAHELLFAAELARKS
jgi:hypothetical protein